MLIYYLLPFTMIYFNFLGVHLKEREKTKLAFIVFIIFSFVCGLRYYSDADYANYIDIFNFVPDFFNITYGNVAHIHSEFGYKLLNSFFKTFISDSGYLFLFFLSMFSMYLKFCFYKRYSNDLLFCLCFYFAIYYVNAEFIQVRMGLSLGILCVALHYFFHNNLKLFLLFVILATAMHSICSVFFLLLFLNRINERKLCFLALIVPIVFSIVPVFDYIITFLSVLKVNSSLISIALNYSDNETYNAQVTLSNLTPLRHFILSLFILYIVLRLECVSQFETLVFKVYLVGIVLASFFMEVEIIYGRIQLLFDIVEPIVVLYVLNRFDCFRSLKFFTLLVVMLLMVKVVLTSTSLQPYNTWLFT